MRCKTKHYPEIVDTVLRVFRYFKRLSAAQPSPLHRLPSFLLCQNAHCRVVIWTWNAVFENKPPDKAQARFFTNGDNKLWKVENFSQKWKLYVMDYKINFSLIYFGHRTGFEKVLKHRSSKFCDGIGFPQRQQYTSIFKT